MKMDKATKEYLLKSSSVEDMLTDILKIINDSGELLEGNSFYRHKSTDLYPELFTKQVNLYWAGNGAKKICEIGFNAGHSAMLMLLNDISEMTIFDLAEHKYTIPSFNYLKERFSNVQFEFVQGDSTLTVSNWITENPEMCGTYDVVHVDGGHTFHCIQNDMKNAMKLVRKGGMVIVDDVYIPYIQDIANSYIGQCENVPILTTIGYTHRILRKVLD
jgi:predicted O-methyltransferase YrrM